MLHLPARSAPPLHRLVPLRAPARVLDGGAVARIAAVLACALALQLVFSPVALAEKAEAAPSKRPESWYTSSVAKDEAGSSLTVHFWSKGPLLRSEAVLAGRSIVTVVDATTYYIFERISAQGVAIERSPRAIAQDATRGRPFGNELEDIMRRGGELIETKQTNIGPVDVFRATNSNGRRTVMMSTKAPRVPLQVETFDRATSTTGRIDYLNWIYGPDIPDSFFEPDPRLELERVTYEQYRKRVGREPIGPAPVLYSDLLHGTD